MFFKLKKSGVDFSKIKELNKIENKDMSEIQDFISLPKKDNFKIKPNKFNESSEKEYYSNNISPIKLTTIINASSGTKIIGDVDKLIDVVIEEKPIEENPQVNIQSAGVEKENKKEKIVVYLKTFLK